MKLELLKNDKADNNIIDIVIEKLKCLSDDCQKMVNITVDEDVIIELKDSNKKRISVTIMLWRNTVNLYIGIHSAHYADDVSIENEEDLKEFEENLKLILSSKIKEVIGERDRDYAYYDTSGSWKWDENLKNKKGVEYREYIYESWIV